MLAVAQGLLSPTKTGGFGESLGLAAGNIQAPLAAMRKEKLDAQSKIDNLQLTAAKLAAEAPMWQARAQHYGNMGLGKNGEGTPNSQMAALRSDLVSLQSMTDDYAAEAGFDKNAEIAAILKQMAQVRKLMKSAPNSSASDETGQDAIPTIKTQSQYDKLPPGSTYTDPEGNVRTKPAGIGERG